MSTTSFVLFALVAFSSFLGSSSAHMMLKNPVPYGKSDLDTSPLSATGGDYPCKQRANVYNAEGASNSYAVGASVPLTFSGSAVHGGGSCQIALTSDKAPTVSTQWQVIASIYGCPVTGDSTSNGSPSDYNFTIPTGVAPGEYTLAWTWNNKIGNREMYMNCAPFTVTAAAGSKTKKSLDARMGSPFAVKGDKDLFERDNSSSTFPDLYLSNICGGCQTPEMVDIVYPQPGDSVQTLVGSATTLLVKPTCSCDKSQIKATGAPGSSGSNSGSGSGSGSGSSAAATTTAAATMASSGNGFVSTPIATQTVISTADPAAATGSSSGSAGSTSSSGSTGSTGSDDGSSGSSSSGSNGTASTSGSASGSLQCTSDGTKFRLSDSSPWQAVAAGTKCSSGAVNFSSS